MSNRIAKGVSILTLVVGLALVVAVESTNGQVTSHGVIAEIPFDFIVGDETLPAGKYTVSSPSSSGGALRILSRDGKAAAFRLSNSVADKSKKQNPRLVFHRYGQEYFLAQVWSGNSYGEQLTTSKRERNLQREMPEIASKTGAAKASYQVVEVVAMLR